MERKSDIINKSVRLELIKTRLVLVLPGPDGGDAGGAEGPLVQRVSHMDDFPARDVELSQQVDVVIAHTVVKLPSVSPKSQNSLTGKLSSNSVNQGLKWIKGW